MTDSKKEAEKTELQDEDLDDVQGGAGRAGRSANQRGVANQRGMKTSTQKGKVGRS